MPPARAGSESPLRRSQALKRRLYPRAIYFLCAIAVLTTGLASRRFRSHLPQFVADYAGDTLWALMLFLLVSTLLANRPILIRAALSLALAFLVEISQLYHAPWIDSIRQSTLGGLVLGFGFLWTDLLCYAGGIAIGAVIERAVGSRHAAKVRESF